jgi:hypothetical protein
MVEICLTRFGSNTAPLHSGVGILPEAATNFSQANVDIDEMRDPLKCPAEKRKDGVTPHTVFMRCARGHLESLTPP